MSTISTQKAIAAAFNPNITHHLYLLRRGLLKAFKRLIPQLQGKLMDLGCGLKPYRSLFNVDEYIGVEYHGDGPTYDKGFADVFYDGHTLPFPDGHFDSVFSSEVFEHIFNLPEILPELNRVMVPGGKMLVSFPFALGEHEAPADFARYTSFAMRHLLETNGFEVIELVKTGSYVEAVMQLRMVYWELYLLKPVKNIPIVRSIIRKSVFSIGNIWALFLNSLLPKGTELYMNIVVLAKKK